MNHSLAHEFGHAAVRGGGYAAGRQLEHALSDQFGIWAIVAIVLLALLMGRGSRR